MKKVFMFVMLSLLVISMLGVVSASSTIIAGKIYNADFTAVISGATVEVTCGGITNPVVQSLSDGAYAVTYDGSVCSEGKSLSVYAFKSGVGENTVTGVIHDNIVAGLDLNLGVVNVPLVPEFGLIAGMVAVLGALGTFFIVRRK